MRLIDVDTFKREHRMADMCCDCDRTIRECEYDSGFSLMDFCGWLDDAHTIEKQQWIPCSERLPEKKGMYLASVKDYVVMEMWSGTGWWATKPIAWMPLPEPWKGEKNETCNGQQSELQ